MLTRLTSNAAVANGRMEVSRLRVTTRRKAADIRSANELAPKLIHTSGGAASIVNRVAAGITETAAQKTTRTRATKRSPPAPASDRTRLTSNAAVANGRMEVSRLRVTTRRKAADIRSANELAPKLIHTSGGAASIVNRVAAGITETAAQKTTRTRATKRSPPAPA